MNDDNGAAALVRILDDLVEIEKRSAEHLLYHGFLDGRLGEKHRPCETESRAQLARNIYHQLTGACLRCEAGSMHEWHYLGVGGKTTWQDRRNSRFLTVVRHPESKTPLYCYPLRGPKHKTVFVENDGYCYICSMFEDAVAEGYGHKLDAMLMGLWASQKMKELGL